MRGSPPAIVLALLIAECAMVSGCAGYGPLGEPEPGVAGLKAAEQQHETAKMGRPGVTPRGGGSAQAPTGPDGDPTVGRTDSVQPQQLQR